MNIDNDKIRVLIITGILPIQALSYKRDENDVILITEDEIKKNRQNIEFTYLFLYPYSNWFLGLFSKKWKELAKFRKKNTVMVKGREVYCFPLFLLPVKTVIQRVLNVASIFFIRKKLVKLLREKKPTVVHAHSVGAAAYLAKYIKRKYGVPYILTVRGLKNTRRKSLISSVSDADRLISVSPSQQRELKNICGLSSSLIPHGVQDSDFLKTAKEPVNFPHEPIKMLTVARLLEYKNIDKIIHQLPRFEQLLLTVVGRGPQADRLKSLAESLGVSNRVSFIGRIPQQEVISIMRSHHLFILLSFPETFGRVYLEAMANGLPIIGAKNTGIDGMVTNMVNGILVNHNDETEISGALDLVLKDPVLLGSLRKNGYALATKYSWASISREIYSLYSDYAK